MTQLSYQRAFFLAGALCALLAVAVVYLLLHQDSPTHAASDASDPVVARGPEAVPGAVPSPAMASSSSEPALTPVQISPTRLQEIGVTMAEAELKNVTDELHVPGNVDIDEQRLSYVQTRFAGWIQNVSANATYQYVSKGQRLFTIYSPDLVSTEQEYLLAKKNQNAFATDMHGTAAEESDWLLQAAEERLRQFDVSPAAIATFEQELTEGNQSLRCLEYNVQTVMPITQTIKAEAAQYQIPIADVSETVQPPTLSFQVWQQGEVAQLQNCLNAEALGQ